MRGKKHSEETKLRMSQSRRGKSWLHDASPERRAAFGQAISESKRKKQSERQAKA